MPDVHKPPGTGMCCSESLLLSEFMLMETNYSECEDSICNDFSQRYFEWKYFQINTSAGAVESLKDLGRAFGKMP